MSRPVWARGLKHREVCVVVETCVAPRVGAWIETPRIWPIAWKRAVAPRVGAWIETKQANLVQWHPRVAPRVGAWIETCFNPLQRASQRTVAPRVGAWIETFKFCSIFKALFVAPRVGAWIETSGKVIGSSGTPSRPVWARGLKLYNCYRIEWDRQSRPVWARGLKPEASIPRFRIS